MTEAQVVNTNRAKRTYQKSPIDVALRAAQVLNLSNSELSIHLGYADNAVSGWIAEKSMPKIAATLCQYMIREATLKESANYKVVLIKVNKGKDLEVLDTIIKALSLESVAL